MDEGKMLMEMMGTKGESGKNDKPRVTLTVDGQEITDPKEICTYVQDNMIDKTEETDSETTEVPGEEDSSYVPGSKSWS